MKARQSKTYDSASTAKVQGNISYRGFHQINGKHPLQSSVPMSHILYRAQSRPNGKVLWFNFDLAKEMGLIPSHHQREMNPELEKTLLDTFSIQIINEYDIFNNVKIQKEKLKPNFYMATRYLQLQHPGKTGMTSGDGRSIWNGSYSCNGQTWDLSSCGTGATWLSPATHLYNKFFKTGDPTISYGCGYSDLDDGVTGALFSEILHNSGHTTERCLAVIEYPGNLSVNVRAAKNLLRPSHFFNHLKQGQHSRLKSMVDYYIQREQSNNKNYNPTGESKYDAFLTQITETFAKMAATFESEYIFCWLAWDGDNILMNGGIIDYGSVRQFGLFHHEYRYDDVDRWSTNIIEQKSQAKYIVQTFIQLIEFVKTGQKSPIRKFSNHSLLKRFDQIFKTHKNHLLLKKIGFSLSESESKRWTRHSSFLRFEKIFRKFERETRQLKNMTKVPDGITKDALFCMKDYLREMPKFLLKNNREMTPTEMMDVLASEYCTKQARALSLKRKTMLKKLQESYLGLIELATIKFDQSRKEVLFGIQSRAQHSNPESRVTGDAICEVGKKILNERKKINASNVQKLMDMYIEQQSPAMSGSKLQKNHPLKEHETKTLKSLQRITYKMRYGL